MSYWSTFAQIISVPFGNIDLIWGIVPLYFALLLNELTSSKANFRTAIQTGFSFIWAAAQWLYSYMRPRNGSPRELHLHDMIEVKLFITFLVLVLGAIALISGIRRKFPKYGAFLGHTRFSNYFMIAIFPMQAHYLLWSWDRLASIFIFAVPVWLVLHFGLMPLRK